MLKRGLSFFMSALTLSALHAQLKYPATYKDDQTDTYFGAVVPDPYRWLENDNSDSTRNWVAEQNKVTAAYLSAIPFRNAMHQRMSSLFNYARYTVPISSHGYIYYYKNDGLQNQSVLYRQKGLNGVPEVLVDPNTFSSDGTVMLVDFELSKDGKYAALGTSRGGSDWHTYHVMDMDTKKNLSDSILWVKASNLAWQNNGFYYSRYPEPQPGDELSSKNENQQVWYHTVGTAQSSDQLVYEDSTSPQRFYRAFVSDNARFVFLNISDRGKGLDGNALLYSDSQGSDRSFKPIVKDVGEFLYDIIEVTPDNKFLIKTNDNTPNSKVVLASPEASEMSNWKTVIPEKAEPLESAEMSGGKLFVRYLKDVTSRVYVYQLDGRRVNEVVLPGPGAASGFEGHQDARYVFYSFTSFNFPTRIYKYDIASGKSAVFKKPDVDFDPETYETSQEFYSSKDGTSVPMFIVHKKGLKKDGNNPVLLYAYGGFNITLTPWFSASIVPWLEQGGVFAVANLRGGSEYGEKWHHAGMLEKKQNVFDDFIAAAEYLINKKYTSASKLAIRGGSNGGLLVGAVMNQRPDLFRVAIPEVGVMDMLRFHKFTIGWNWQPEYGSSDNEKDFKNLFGYSPLHNIKSGVDYPATLVTTADHDDRVVPAHSFKYISTLQEKYKGKNPVLIRIDTNSGHGSSNTKKYIDLNTDVYSFIMYNMGLEWKELNHQLKVR
jgi:prolyl oligopeptidase